jgi:hypothetical protein
MNNISKKLKIFRFLVLTTLINLVIEFVLGIYTALFVQFPDTLVNGNGWGWSMSGSPVIIVHVITGGLLFLSAIPAVIFGFTSHVKAATIWSVIGLVMIGLAYFSGSVFLSNVADNNSSFLMALGFMGAVLAYAAAFYSSKQGS